MEFARQWTQAPDTLAHSLAGVQAPSIWGKKEGAVDDPPLVCVIDDRCSFASQAFGGRIESVWNQSTDKRVLEKLDRVDVWRKPDDPLLNRSVSGSSWYGRVLVPKALPSDQGGEFGRYRLANYLYPTPQWSHGSAVLDLLAGHDVRLKRAGPGILSQEIGRQRWHLPPPEKIVFVQLPVSTVFDTSGGSLAAHIIDGIQHAVTCANEGQSVIVNLSYGTHGGPHDGGSMFERGLLELLNLFDGCSAASQGKTLHVVVPAGNSHLLRCHAAESLAPGCEMRLRWKVLPDDQKENFVEVWAGVDDQISITVQPPDGECSPPIKVGEAWSFCSAEGTHAAVVFPRQVAQRDRGSMALLAVAPTREGGYVDADEPSAGTPQSALASHGVWTVLIRNLKESNGRAEQCATVHAWAQRGDFAPGRGRESRGYVGRQSYFVDDGSRLVNPRFTLNGIATMKHPRLFVVGAMRHHDHCVSRYTAAGPDRGTGDRTDGPDLVTIGDESINLPGLLLRGISAGSRVRVSGTSVAAPLVARLLYEHLCLGRTAESFVHTWSADRCSHEEPAGPGYPEPAEPIFRGFYQRLIPTNDDGSLIGNHARLNHGQVVAEEAGGTSPHLPRGGK